MLKMKRGSLENELGEGRVEISMIKKKILMRSSKQNERRRSIRIKKDFFFFPNPIQYIYFFLRHNSFDYQIF